MKKVSGIAAASSIEKPFGTGSALVSSTLAVFGIAAAGEKGADPFAEPEPGGAVPERYHFARHLEAGNIDRCTGRRRILAAPLHDVGTVNAGGADLDQDLARTRQGNRARSAATSISGPPGALITIAVIISGSAATAGNPPVCRVALGSIGLGRS